MKNRSLLLAMMFCGIIALVGCTIGSTRGDIVQPIMEEIIEWPMNEYTNEIIQPEEGIPDYVVYDQKAGYYAIFLKEITMEQGEKYIEVLKNDGYKKVVGEGNEFAIGELLIKDTVHLSISLSDNGLGIYISLDNK